MATLPDNPPVTGQEQDSIKHMSDFMALSPEQQETAKQQKKDLYASQNRTMMGGTIGNTPIAFGVSNEVTERYDNVIEFSTALFDGRALGDIYLDSRDNGQHVVLMDKEDFSFNYGKQLTEQGKDPEEVYSDVEKNFFIYNTSKKAILPTTYATLPPTAIVKRLMGDTPYRTSELPYIKLTNNKLYVPGNEPIDLYSTAHEANQRNYYKDKTGAIIPLELAKFKVTNSLKEVVDENGDTSWEEAQDGELVPSDIIRGTTERKLFTENNFKGFAAGAAFAIADTWFGATQTIPFVLRASLDFSDIPLNEKEYYKAFIDKRNNANAYWQKNTDQAKGAFENKAAFMYNLGNGMAQMFSIMATSGMTSLALKTGSKLAGKGAAKLASKYAQNKFAEVTAKGLNKANIGDKLVSNIAVHTGSFVATGAVASHTYDELVINGIEPQRAARQMWAYMAGTYASEMIFPFAQKMGASYAIHASNKGFTKEAYSAMVKEVLGKEGFKNVKNMTDKQLNGKIKQIWKGFTEGKYLNNLEKAAGKAGPVLGRGVRATGMAGAESAEEVIEGGLHSLASVIYNGFEASDSKDYVDFYDNKIFFEQEMEGKKTGKWIMQDKNDNKEITVLSKGEYDTVQSRLKKSKRILNGEMVYPTGVSVEEAGMAGISSFAFGLFMPGASFNSSVKSQEAMFNAARSEVDKGGVREQVANYYDDMIKNGSLGMFENPLKQKEQFLNDFDIAVDMVRKHDIRTAGRYSLLRAGRHLSAKSFKENNNLLSINANLASLVELKEGLKKTGTVQEDVEKLGVKKGMTEADIDRLIAQQEQDKASSEAEIKYLEEPQKKTVVTPGENKGVVNREKTDEPVVVNGKEKETSAAYSDIIYDIERQEKYAEEASKNSLKELEGAEWTKEYKRLDEQQKGKYYQEYMKNRFISELENKFKGLKDEEFSGKFKTWRDYYLSFAHLREAFDKQEIESFDEKAVLEKTRFPSEGGFVSTSNKLTSFVKDLQGLMSSGDVGGDTHKAKLGAFNETLNGLLNTLGGVQGVYQTDKEIEDVAALIDNELQKIDNLDAAGAFSGEVDDESIEGLKSLSESLMNVKKRPDKFDVNEMTDDQKIQVLEDMLTGVAEKNFGGKDESSLFDEMALLVKESEKAEEFKGFADSEGVKKKAIDFLNFIETFDNYITDNIDFVQGYLEQNEDLAEHSPLLEENTKLPTKGSEAMAAFKAKLKKGKENAKIVVEKSEVASLNRDVNYQTSKISSIDYELRSIQSLVDIVEQFPEQYTESDKKVSEQIDKGLGELSAIIEADLKDGTKITSIDDLFKLYLSKKELRDEVNERMNSIESKTFEIKELLSGKVDGLIKQFNSFASQSFLTYYDPDPSDSHMILDRSASNLQTNKGLLSGDSFEKGKRAFFEIANSKQNIDSRLYDVMPNLLWYYQQTLNMLNDMNNLGKENVPTYSQIVLEARDQINKDKDIVDFLSTYEQEQAIISIVSMAYSPKNDFIKAGYSKEFLENNRQLKDVVDNLLYLKGFGGSGKSTVVIKKAFQTLSSLKGNKTSSVAVITPNKVLQSTQEKNFAIKDEKTDKPLIERKEFLLHEVMKDPSIVEGYEFVILEESTVLPESEQAQLKKAIRNSKATWLTLGDNSQPTQVYLEDGTVNPSDYYIMQDMGRRTRTLTEVFRQNQVQSRLFMDNIIFTEYDHNTGKEYFEVANKWKVAKKGGTKIGIQKIPNKSTSIKENGVVLEFLDYVEEYKTQKEDGEVILIVFTTKEKEELMEMDKFKNFGHLIKTLEYPYKRIMAGEDKLSDDLVSGMERDAVFLAVDFGVNDPATTHPLLKKVDAENKNTIDYKSEKRFALVGTTRHRKYLAIVGNEVGAKIEKENEDSSINGYDNTGKNIDDYQKILREHLVGTDGTGGRYGAITKNTKPFVDIEIPNDNSFDRNIILSKEGKVQTLAAVGDKINELKESKKGSHRMSELGSTVVENEDIAVGKVINAFINHINTKNNGTDEQIKSSKAIATDLLDKYKKSISEEEAPEGYFDFIVSRIVLTGGLEMERKNELAIVAPYVNVEKDDTVYSGQPNLVKVVGFALDAKGNKIPIVDVVNYRPTTGRTEWSEIDKESTGRHIAGLVANGFRLNKVTDVGLNVSKFNDNEISFNKTWSDEEVIEMLEKGNQQLGLERTDKKNELVTKQELDSNEHVIPEITINKGTTSEVTLKTYQTVQSTGGKVKYFITDIITKTDKVGNVSTYIETKPYGKYDANTTIRNINTYGKPRGFKVLDSIEDSVWHNEQAKRFKQEKSLWSTSLGGMMINGTIGNIPGVDIIFETFLTDDNNPLMKAKLSLLGATESEDLIKKSLVLDKGAKTYNYDKVTGERNSINYILYDKDNLVYSVLIEHEFTDDLLDLKEVKDLISTVRGLEGANDTMIPEIKDNVPTETLLSVSNASDVDIFFAMGLNVISAQGHVEMEYKTNMESNKVSAEKKAEIKELLQPLNEKKAETKEERYEAIKNFMNENAFKIEIKEQDGKGNVVVVEDKYRQLNVNLNISKLQELWSLINEKNNVLGDYKSKGQGRAILEDTPINSLEYVTEQAKKDGFEYESDATGPVFIVDENDTSIVLLPIWRFNGEKKQHIIFKGRSASKEDVINMIDSIKDEVPRSGEKRTEIAWLWTDSMSAKEQAVAKRAYFSALRNSQFMQFINYNKQFVKEAIENNGQVAMYLEYNEKRGKHGAIDLLKPFRLIKDARIIVDALQEHGAKTNYNLKLSATRSVFDKDEKNAFVPVKENLVTRFSSLNMPDVYTMTKGDTSFNKEYNGETVQLVSEETATDEITRIVGQVDNSNLFFNDGIFVTSNGTKVWGNIRDGVITLSSFDGYVSKDAARHEAMHKVMLNLLKPEEYSKVMKEAEKRMIKENKDLSGNSYQKDTKINEYIAEQFETNKPLPKTYFGKAIKWLRDSVNRLFSRRDYLDSFFDRVDAGFYANNAQAFYQDRNSDLDKKYEKKYSNKEHNDLIREVFVSANLMDNVIGNHILPKWVEYSPYGKDFTRIKVNWHDTLNEMARHYSLMRDKELEATEENGTIHTIVSNEVDKDGNNLVLYTGLVKDMKAHHYHQAVINNNTEKRPANEAAIRAYEAFQLGNDEVLFTMVQAAFPALDIELLETGNATSVKVKEIYDKQNELTNPMDSKSQFFSMVLSTIPYYDTHRDKVLPNRYVNFNQLNKLLLDTYMGIHASGRKQGFKQVLEVLAEKENLTADPRTRNIIRSFIREYGDSIAENRSYKDGIAKEDGYYFLANLSKKLIRTVQVLSKQDDFPLSTNNIVAKSNQIATIITGLDSYYSSLSLLINTSVEWKNGKPQMKTAFNMSERVIKNNIKQSISSALFQTDTKIVSPKGRALVDGTGKYDVRSDGSISKLNNKTGEYESIMEDSETYLESDVLGLLHDMGIRVATPSMIDLIFRTKKNLYDVGGTAAGYGSGSLMTKDDLYKFTTSMLYSIKVNDLIRRDVEALKAGDKIGWSDATNNYLEKYNKSTERYFGFNTITLEDLQAVFDKVGDQRGFQDKLPSPDNFWQSIENNFAFLVRNEMNELTSRMTVTVEGQYAYSHPMGTYLSDMIPSGLGASFVLADTIKKDVKEIDNFEDNPLYDKDKGAWNNPILNRFLAFDYYDNFDGIKVNDKGIKYFDLTAHDFLKNFIEGLMLNSAKKNDLQVPVHTDIYGDRPNNNIFHIHLHGYQKRNVSRFINYKTTYVKGADGTSRPNVSFNIERDAVVESMEMIARYHVKLQKLAKKNYEKVKKLSSIDEVLASDAVSGRDYIIKGGEVLPGNAVTMVDNKTDKSPYLRLSYALGDNKLSLDAKYQMILKAFTDRYDLFTAYLDEQGYELPKDLLSQLDGGIWQEENKINSFLGYVDNVFNDLNLDEEGKKEKILNNFKKRDFDDSIDGEFNTLKSREDITDDEIYEEVKGIHTDIKAVSTNAEFGKLRKQEVTSIGRYKKEDAGLERWNPVLEAAFMLHTVFNDSMNPLLRGSVYNYANEGNPYLDFLKRAGLKAPGNKYSQDERLTAMGKESRVLFMQDIPLNEMVEVEVLNEDGITTTKETKRVPTLKMIGDGSIIITPWTHSNLQFDSGGEISSVGEGMIKNVQFDVDHANSRVNYPKAAMMPISPAHYNSPFMKDMLRLALGEVANYRIKDNQITEDETVPTVFESFEEDFVGTRAWFTSYLYTTEGRETKKRLIDYFVYQSASKTNNSRVHKISNDYDNVIADGFLKDNDAMVSNLNNDGAVRMLSNKHLRLQQATSQDTVDQKKTIATQILFLAGVLDHNDVIIQEINDALADMSQPIHTILEDITTPAEAINFIRKLGKEQSFSRRASGRFMELIENDGINLNIFRQKLTNVFANHLRDYTLPNMPGQNYIQAPYYGRVYMSKEGIPFMEEDVREFTDEMKGTLTARRIVHQNYNDGTYAPAEIVIPFNHVAKFGIDKGVTMIRSMTVQTEEGHTLLYGMDEASISAVVTDHETGTIFRSMTKGQQEVIKKLTRADKETGISSYTIKSALVKYFTSYNEALKAIGVRIPTSNASTAFSAIVVGFDHLSSNTVYVPVDKSIWDGSDYDIDALSIYFKAIDNDLTISVSDEKGNQNRIFNGLEAYYNNVQNKPLVQEKIDMQYIIDRAADIPNKLYSADLGSAAKSLVFAREGSKLVGHFANLENAISRILSLPKSERESLFPNTVADRSPEEMINTIATLANLINAATDNEKLGGALGLLNINQVTSPLIAGLVLKGKTLEQIIDTVNLPEVKEATQKVVDNQNALKGGYASTVSIGSHLGSELGQVALLGEGLRRLSDIMVLQRKVSPSSEDLWNIKKNFEFIFGRPFVEITTIREKTLNLKDQVDFVKETYPNKIDEIDEVTIRDLMNIDVIISSERFRNIRNLIDIYNYQYEMNTDVYIGMNEVLLSESLNLLGINNFYTKDQFGTFASEIDKQAEGWFLSGKKVFIGDVDYNLGTTKGRYDFVTNFTDYVQALKDDNEITNDFIREVSIQGTITTGGNDRIEMTNITMMSPLQLSQYKGSFNELSPDIKYQFELYNMLVYGMASGRGSLGEIVTNDLVLEYSKFLNDEFNGILNDKVSRDIFVDNLVVSNESFMQVLYGNSKKLPKDGKYYSHTDNRNSFVINKETGEQVGIVKSSLYNTYINSSMIFKDTKEFFEVKKEDLAVLEEKGSSVRIHQGYISNTKERLSSNLFMESNVDKHYIVGNSRALLPNGTYGNLTVKKHGIVDIASTSNKSEIKESRIVKQDSSVAEDVIDLIIGKFQASFPNIDIIKVNNSSYEAKGNSIAWIENGVVYLNVDKLQSDTLMHEFIGHIFVDLIEKINPKAFSSLKAEAIDILNNTEEGKLVKNKYNDVDRPTLIKEIIANMIGWNSQSDVETYIEALTVKGIDSIKKGIWNRIEGALRDIRAYISRYLNSLFGVSANVDISTATIRDMSLSALGALQRGDVITYMSSKTYVKLNNAARYDQKDNIEVSSIEDVFTVTSSDRNKKERDIHRIKNALMSNTGDKSSLSYALKKKFHNISDVDIAKLDPETILAQMKLLEREFGDSFVKLLGMPNPASTESIMSAMPLVNKKSLFDEGVIAKLLRAISYDTTTEYYRYSDFVKKDEYKHFKSKDLEAHDPIIGVEVSKEGTLMLNIFDITPNKLESYSKESMFHAFGVKYDASKDKIGFKDNETDHRRFALSLLFNHIMSKDKNVNVRSMAVINLMGDVINSFPIEANDVNKGLNNISALDGFMELVKSEDMNNVLKGEKYYPALNYWDILVARYKKDSNRSAIMNTFLTDDGKSIEDKASIILQRLKQLTYNKNEEDEYSADEIREITLLQNALEYTYVMGNVSGHENPLSHSVGTIEGFTTLQSMIGDVTFQKIKSIEQLASAELSKNLQYEIENNIDVFYKRLRKEYVKTHTLALGGKVVEQSHKVWGQINATIKDNKGVERNIGGVYWTNKTEGLKGIEFAMAKRAQELNISQELLDIGKDVVDYFEGQLKRAIFYKKVNNSNTTDYWNYAEKRMLKLEDITLTDLTYFKGMMPLMPETATEAAGKGKIGKWFNKRILNVTDLNEVFNFAEDHNERIDQKANELLDMFFWQFGYNDTGSYKTPLGHPDRVKYYLGLEEENFVTKSGEEIEQWKTIDNDDKTNSDLSLNLSNTLRYFVGTVERKQVYETKVLPTINGAKVMLADMIKHKSNPALRKRLQASIDYLNLFTKQTIKNEITPLGFERADTAVGKIAMATISVAAPITMALNLNIAAVGAISNLMFAGIEAGKNSLVENGIFNFKDLSEVNPLFFINNYTLLKELLKDFQVMNTTEVDLLNSMFWRAEGAKANIMDKFNMNAANWATDFFARATVMAAQMKHDGTWDAYSINDEGVVEYDHSKNRMYRSKDGTQTEDQKILEDFLKLELTKEGIHGQTVEGAIVRGYTNRTQQKLRAVADTYVTGAYTSEDKAVYGSVILARLFRFFKTFGERIVAGAFGRESNQPLLGMDVVVTDVWGNKVVKREALQTEGYLRMIWRQISLLKNDGWKNTREGMTAVDKRNWKKIYLTIATYSLTYIMYNLAVLRPTPGDEEDDKIGFMEENRILRNFIYATQSLYGLLVAWDWMLHPFASLDIVTGFVTDPLGRFSVSGGNYPFKSQFNTFGELTGLKDDEK